MHKLKLTLICLVVGGSQLVQAKNLITTATSCMGSSPSIVRWAALVKDINTGVACSGILISPNFALTARSCVSSNNIIVYPSSGDVVNHPMDTGIVVNKVLTAPVGDLALLHLATNPQNGIAINDYPVLDYNYQFTGVTNCTSPVMGYTHKTDSPQKETYFKAAVEIDGVASTNAQYDGDLIIVNKFSGNPPKSDRGGPILIDNKVAGLNSIDGARYYTSFSNPQVASWIKARGYYQNDCPDGVVSIIHADDMDGGYGDAHISGFASSSIPVMVRADKGWTRANVNPSDGSWSTDITYRQVKRGSVNVIPVTAQQSTPAGEVCTTATKLLRVGSYDVGII